MCCHLVSGIFGGTRPALGDGELVVVSGVVHGLEPSRSWHTHPVTAAKLLAPILADQVKPALSHTRKHVAGWQYISPSRNTVETITETILQQQITNRSVATDH